TGASGSSTGCSSRSSTLSARRRSCSRPTSRIRRASIPTRSRRRRRRSPDSTTTRSVGSCRTTRLRSTRCRSPHPFDRAANWCQSPVTPIRAGPDRGGGGCRVTTVDRTDLYYDPYDVDINADPYPVFRRLREEAPLYHNEPYDFYALSRYEDVERGFVD